MLLFPPHCMKHMFFYRTSSAIAGKMKSLYNVTKQGHLDVFEFRISIAEQKHQFALQMEILNQLLTFFSFFTEDHFFRFYPETVNLSKVKSVVVLQGSLKLTINFDRVILTLLSVWNTVNH